MNLLGACVAIKKVAGMKHIFKITYIISIAYKKSWFCLVQNHSFKIIIYIQIHCDKIFHCRFFNETIQLKYTMKNISYHIRILKEEIFRIWNVN